MRVKCEVEISDGSTVTALDIAIDSETNWKSLADFLLALVEGERLMKQLLEGNSQ